MILNIFPQNTNSNIRIQLFAILIQLEVIIGGFNVSVLVTRTSTVTSKSN